MSTAARTRLEPRRTLALLVLAAVGVLGAWVPLQPAGAHGDLLTSQPADGSLVETMPSRAFLTFSDEVREVREIALVGPEGSVTNGEASWSGAEVSQNLWAGPAGSYTMSYFLVSADGHDVRGEVRFEVGDLSVVPEPDPDADVTPAPRRATGEREDESLGVAAPAAVVALGAVVALLLALRRRTNGPG